MLLCGVGLPWAPCCRFLVLQLLFEWFNHPLPFVEARRNVTIDEDSSLITYYPASSWSKVTGDLDAGGGHMLTQDINAYASLKYTFVSFWVMSTKWPYPVTTEYVLDGKQTVIDLQDHGVANTGGGGGTVTSSIVAGFIGSSSQQHEIGIFVPPGGQFAVLDRLIFEVEDDTSSTTTQAPRTSIQTVVVQTTTGAASSQSNTSATSASTSNTTRTLAIALGIAGPLLAILIIFLVWWFFFRQRREEPQTPLAAPSSLGPEKSVYSSGDGSMYGPPAGGMVGGQGLHHATSGQLSGYGIPTGSYHPYTPSPSPGTGGVGYGGGIPQQPPYPEIQSSHDYSQFGYGQQMGVDGSDGRGSWVPQGSAYNVNTRNGMGV